VFRLLLVDGNSLLPPRHDLPSSFAIFRARWDDTTHRPTAYCLQEELMALPVFVINLARSTDRLGRICAEFDRVGVPFNRFEGVDALSIPSELRRYFCDASGVLTSPLRPGEIGCYASHLALWTRIAGGECGDAALICEDDIRLPDDLISLLDDLIAALPVGWDVVRLSSVIRYAVVPVAPVGCRTLVRFSREPVKTGATLVSCNGARKLLAARIRTRPVDQDLRCPWEFEALDTYGVAPVPIVQDDAMSLVEALGGHTSIRYGRQLRAVPWQRLRHNLPRLGFGPWLKCLIWNVVGRKLMRGRPA